MSSRKELLRLIKNTSLKLYSDKEQLAKHQFYFDELMNNHKLTVVSLLIPAFFTGWQAAKKTNFRQGLNQMTKLGFSSAINSVRRLYLGI